MAFGPTKAWKWPCITILVDYLSLRLPTNSADEANIRFIISPSAASVLALSTLAYESPDSTSERPDSARRTLYHSRANRLNGAAKATDILGMTVRNYQGKDLGKVENLLLDLSSGRIVAIIVSSGGFLGIADELSAAPPTALRFAADRESLVLDASKEMLGNAPHFENSQWPDLGQPVYSHGLYRAYHVEPYFTTNFTAGAANSARSVRERSNRAQTPLVQGNSIADLDITTRIRQGILDGKDMSPNARNVKVITQNGQVTLRGPVNTSEERRLIGDIAIDIALLANVDNQLVVQ